MSKDDELVFFSRTTWLNVHLLESPRIDGLLHRVRGLCEERAHRLDLHLREVRQTLGLRRVRDSEAGERHQTNTPPIATGAFDIVHLQRPFSTSTRRLHHSSCLRFFEYHNCETTAVPTCRGSSFPFSFLHPPARALL